MCCLFLYNYSRSIIPLRYVEVHQCITNVHRPSDQYPISNDSLLLYNYHVILSDDFSVQLFKFKSKIFSLHQHTILITLKLLVKIEYSPTFFCLHIPIYTEFIYLNSSYYIYIHYIYSSYSIYIVSYYIYIYIYIVLNLFLLIFKIIRVFSQYA